MANTNKKRDNKELEVTASVKDQVLQYHRRAFLNYIKDTRDALTAGNTDLVVQLGENFDKIDMALNRCRAGVDLYRANYLNNQGTAKLVADGQHKKLKAMLDRASKKV